MRLGAWFQNEETGESYWLEDASAPVYSATQPAAPAVLPVAAPQWNFPTGNADWTGLLKTAMQTWGSTDVARSQAQSRMPVSTVYPFNAPPQSYFGQPGYALPGAGGASLFGIPTGTLLLLAAAGVAAYLIYKG